MDELASRGRAVLDDPPFHVLVVLADGVPYAIEDACHHAGASLAPGRLDGFRLRCPAHGFVFDVRTGAQLVPARPCERQRTFDVAREGEAWVVYDASTSPLVVESGSTDGEP